MKFSLQESIALLSPEYFKESFVKNNCEFLISVFKDPQHNFVIPTSEFSKEDAERNKAVLEEFKVEGIEFSYYVPAEIDSLIRSIIESTGPVYDCTTRYVFKSLSEKYQIPDYEIIRLSKANFNDFVEAAKVCFPGWENIAFTTWCLNCPNVDMLGVLIDGQIAAFAGYFSKPDKDYVLLMNAGTLPEFRRQGLHDYLIKKRINEVLDREDSATFYADVDDEEASHHGFIKLGFEDGPVFQVYN